MAATRGYKRVLEEGFVRNGGEGERVRLEEVASSLVRWERAGRMSGSEDLSPFEEERAATHASGFERVPGYTDW